MPALIAALLTRSKGVIGRVAARQPVLCLGGSSSAVRPFHHFGAKAASGLGLYQHVGTAWKERHHLLSSQLDRLEQGWRDLFTPRHPSTTKRSVVTSTSFTAFDESANQENASENGKEYSQYKPTPSIVGYWYLASGTLVFIIVLVGGLTRLTESGLSIVEWNVIKGMKPPASPEEWEAEFQKYQQFPEFQLTNHSISLKEFQFIFYMEWAHRMLGRFIGLSFVLPGIYFASRGYLNRSLKLRSLAIGGLIGVQGLLGWLMVKSGLSAHIVEEKQVPRVSHFWLAAHLGTAFSIYSAMLMTGFEVLRLGKVPSGTTPSTFNMAQKLALSLTRFSRLSKALAVLVFLTAMSGALVAGLDAGLIYNEFPYMGSGLIPSDMWAYTKKDDDATSSSAHPKKGMSWIRNLLENPSAVQFNHRVLAMTTLTSVTALWAYSRRLRLPGPSRMAVNTLLGVALAQVSLGIATLIYFVPTPVAAAHQSGSLALLTSALWLVHTLRFR